MARFLLIITLIWLSFTILHEIMTGEVWYWVLPGMSPPILFLLMPILLFLGGLATRKYRTVTCVFAVCAFAVSFQSNGLNINALSPRLHQVGADTSIHVVQMNTDYWGQLRDGTLTDPRDKDAMLAFLRDLNADVYLLQEHMQRDGDFALPVTDLSDIEEVFPEYSTSASGTLLTLSRLPVIQAVVVNPDTTSDIHLPPPPYVLRVDVQAGSEVVSTYNVHMPIQIIIEMNWFSREFYFEIWRRHFIRQDEYQTLTENVVNNPNPLVIAGDFNTSPAMGDNRELLNATEDAAKAGKSLYPSTWRVGGQLPRLWRNDWFLVRNNFRVVRFESLHPQGNSDHLVQSVDLAISGPKLHSETRHIPMPNIPATRTGE